MFDVLPKLWLIESKIKFEDIDYFLLNKKIDWQIKILEIIGINSNKILSAEQYRHIEASRIISVTHPWYLEGYIQEQVANIPSWIIYELRTNFLNKNIEKSENEKDLLENYKKILCLMMPLIPNFASECLQDLKDNSIQKWPKADKKFLDEENINFVIQINGKK